MPRTSHREKFSRNSNKPLSANEIGQFSPSSTARNNFHMEGEVNGEQEEEEEEKSSAGRGGNGTLSDTSRRGVRQVCRCTLSKSRREKRERAIFRVHPLLPLLLVARSRWTRWIIKAARHVWSSFARFVSADCFPVLIFRILEKGSLGNANIKTDFPNYSYFFRSLSGWFPFLPPPFLHL